jgi:hypothetical protein
MVTVASDFAAVVTTSSEDVSLRTVKSVFAPQRSVSAAPPAAMRQVTPSVSRVMVAFVSAASARDP